MTAPAYTTREEIGSVALDLVRAALDARVTASLGDLVEVRRLTRRVAHIAARLDDLVSGYVERWPAETRSLATGSACSDDEADDTEASESDTLPGVPDRESDAPTVRAGDRHEASGVHRPTRQAPPVLIGVRPTDSPEAGVKRSRLSGRRASMTAESPECFHAPVPTGPDPSAIDAPAPVSGDFAEP